jgi:hypothetical protein
MYSQTGFSTTTATAAAIGVTTEWTDQSPRDECLDRSSLWFPTSFL